MTRFPLLLTMALLLALTPGCLQPYSTSGRVAVGGKHGQVAIAFSSRDRQIIHDYYRRHLPPGLAKKGKLTPGHRKRLMRKGHLPPGIEGRSLPHNLASRLAPLPEGYMRLRVGGDVVLMDQRTRLIVDLISDIGR